jgi:hypothetical protein
MAYSVELHVDPRSRKQDHARVRYIATWDGDGVEPTGDLARQAILAYLENTVQNILTGAIRELDPMEDPGTNEWRLSTQYDGFPIAKLDVDEYPESEGYEWEGEALYQFSESTLAQTFDTGGSLTNEAADTPTGASVTKSHAIQSSPQGATIDFAPVVMLLSRNYPGIDWWAPTPPIYPDGAINPVKDDDDGKIKIKGLEYRAPAANRHFTMELQGSAPKTAFVARLAAAADEGVINTDFFTLRGITYPPGTLLLVEHEEEISSSGKSVQRVGFSAQRNIYLPVLSGEDINDDTYWVTRPAGLVMPSAGAVPLFTFWWFEGSVPPTVPTWGGGGTPVFYQTPPDTPDGWARLTWFSGHHYVANFNDTAPNFNVFEPPEGAPSAPATVTQIQNINIHRIWLETSFSTLFGTGVL